MPKATKHPTPELRPPHARRGKAKTATMAEYAAITFQPEPGAVESIGTFAEWVKTCGDKYGPLRVGLHSLTYNDVDLTERMRLTTDHDPVFAVADWLGVQQKAFEGIARLCQTAQIRYLVALSRVGVEQEQSEVTP